MNFSFLLSPTNCNAMSSGKGYREEAKKCLHACALYFASVGSSWGGLAFLRPCTIAGEKENWLLIWNL